MQQLEKLQRPQQQCPLQQQARAHRLRAAEWQAQEPGGEVSQQQRKGSCLQLLVRMPIEAFADKQQQQLWMPRHS
jgi:hypothetical protein